MIKYKLCYVEGCWAYFTSQPLEKQWGDDWNDAPYEHNAGTPYNPTLSGLRSVDGAWVKYSEYKDGVPDWTIIKLAFDANLETPASVASGNSSYSVEMINAGAVAWLTDRWGKSGISIPAGVSPEQFEELITKAGGTVYVPSSINKKLEY